MGMFDEIERLGTPLKTLRFDTKKGTSIELVSTDGEIPDGKLMQYRDMASKLRWKTRRRPTLGYNCAGLVWANRRGEILDDVSVETILRDDAYRRIDALSGEAIAVGDIALYRSEGVGFVHVGLVVASEEGTGDRNQILLLSKMDGGSGEYIHRPQDVSFGLAFRLDYYTERPKETPWISL